MGTAHVTATYQGATGTVTISLTEDLQPKVATVVATPSSVPADNTTASQIIATVKDKNGNVVGSGIDVSWHIKSGYCNMNYSTVTNSSGQALNTCATDTAGPVTITAQTNEGGPVPVTITFTHVDGNIDSISASSTTISNSGGSSASVLTAYLLDSNGNLVSTPNTVTWTTDLGTFTSSSSTSDTAGRAQTTFISSQAGIATITATGPLDSKSIQIVVSP